MHLQWLAADQGIAPVLHEGRVGQVVCDLRRAFGNAPHFIVFPAQDVDVEPVDLDHRNVIEEGGDAVTMSRGVPVQYLLADPLDILQGPISGLLQGPQRRANLGRASAKGSTTPSRGGGRFHIALTLTKPLVVL